MGIGVGSIVSVGGTSSGGSGGSGSGIQEINGQTGPVVTIVGVSGISVTSINVNEITIGFNGKYAATFSGTTSGIFSHNLGTFDVIVQVYDDRSPRRQILPDEIKIENSNQVSVLFNTPQSGRVVII